ncbi:ABC transporter permease [Cellulomonas sp. KRMCY2]|uniref:ABC transporter permease n=1 Tax=Cellulomonas sp. KRMCY2 TaxID=1304865 RepID=UPI0004A35F08|nr:ABC transporter permease [Cellulomonas sp. KRMCY2]
MRAVLAIAAVELRRFLKDRSNIFFTFIFPLLLVLLIGSQFGGSSRGQVAVAGPDSALRTAVTTALVADGLDVTGTDEGGVREQVARGRSDVGILIPVDAAAAFEDHTDLRLDVIPSSQAGSQAVAQRVRTALGGVVTEQGQLAALAAAGVEESPARSALLAAAGSATPPRLAVADVDEVSQEFAGLGQFGVSAAPQLLLFVFLISLAGSESLIRARRSGVMSRTLAAPVSTTQAIAGQGLGRLAIATFQGGYIMAATALLFDVDWGNLALSLLVMVVFALVAAGAAMVVGSVMDNDSAAVGVGIGLGLVLAALGGSMLPLELFPDSLRTIAHVTPHAWAYEAFAEIQRHEATLADILPQLGVLAGYASVLLLAGAWLLRRSLARAI